MSVEIAADDKLAVGSKLISSKVKGDGQQQQQQQ